MFAPTKRRTAKSWFRFALKLGLLATDAAIWTSVGRLLNDREDTRDALRPRGRMPADFRAHREWSHASTLLAGVGIGVGLGILFAPMSGEQARIALRQAGTNLRNRMNDVAEWAGDRWASSPYQRRSTGTYAD
jgi:hypothetical protein